eukprot:333819_1
MQDQTLLESNELQLAMERLLSKHNHGEFEIVKICRNIIKINKRNKKQERLFVLTDKAVYNIKSGKIIKRRIPLSDIGSITKSSVSTEFTINVPSEYDYRFDAGNKTFRTQIISGISRAITDLKHAVLINTIHQSDLSTWTVTKKDLASVSEQHDETVRTVMAVIHLENMGFKSKTARKSFVANGGRLSCTIQSLVGDYAKDASGQSPFRSPSMSPISMRLTPTVSPKTLCHLSPRLSITEEIDVDDAFIL